METSAPARRYGWLTALAVAAAGLLAYGNALEGGFVWDDASSILLHKTVQDPARFAQLFKEDQHAYGRGQGNFYRPLVAASFMLDYALAAPDDAAENDGARPESGINASLFHLSSVLWHVAAALLLLALLVRMNAPPFVQVIVGLLYVVHPLHTEAVAYISGRADSMSAAFIFAALLFATMEGAPGRYAAGAVLSTLCFCAALLSKEAALIYPVLLALVILLRPVGGSLEDKKRAYGLRSISLACAAAVLVAYVVLRRTVLSFGTQETLPPGGIGERAVDAAQAFALYIKLLFIPTDLHMERTLEGVPSWVAIAGVLLFLACVGLLVYGVRSKHWRIALGMGWFLAGWFPISGLIPLNAPMAEHWMYLPMAGFWLAIGELVWAFSRNDVARRAVPAAAFALFLIFLGLTTAQNKAWASNETLYRATLSANPGTARVHFNLAVTYEDMLGNIPGARRHYEKVVELYEEKKERLGTPKEYWDEELEAHLSLGRIYLEQGRYEKAAQHFQVLLSITSLKHRDMIGIAALGMGQCFLASGQPEQAGQLFRRAVALRPELAEQVKALMPGLELK